MLLLLEVRFVLLLEFVLLEERFMLFVELLLGLDDCLSKIIHPLWDLLFAATSKIYHFYGVEYNEFTA